MIALTRARTSARAATWDRPEGDADIGFAHIHQGQALQIEFAEDHALAEAFHVRKPMRLASDSSVSPTSRLLRASDAARRLRMTIQSIRPRSRGETALAGLPHHFGIDAGIDDVVVVRVDLRQHGEIHETVVDRGDQRVGMGVAVAREIGVRTRAVDDDDFRAGLGEFGEGGIEARRAPRLRLPGGCPASLRWTERKSGQRQVDALAASTKCLRAASVPASVPWRASRSIAPTR